MIQIFVSQLGRRVNRHAGLVGSTWTSNDAARAPCASRLQPGYSHQECANRMHLEVGFLNGFLGNIFDRISNQVVVEFSACNPFHGTFVVLRTTPKRSCPRGTVSHYFTELSCSPLPAEARQ